MQYTKHSLHRMNGRGINHAIAKLVFDYGYTSGDKVIFNKKMACERLIEARAEVTSLSNALNIGGANMGACLHQLADLETEIRNLTKLVDKHGAILVMVDDVLITAYGIH